MKLHEKEMRTVYAETLNELISQNKNIFCLEADLAKATGTNPIVSETYPNNFINVGVAEANMIGVAAGLAVDGKVPFCASFSCFASRRVYDQITLSVAYANTNVKIIGAAPGVTQGPNGGTHMCFQDLAIMRAMPNMQVLSPCDVYELKSMLYYMANTYGGMYMQLVRPKVIPIFDENYQYEHGKAVKISEGSDVTIVTTGFMTHIAKQAVDELKEENINVELLHYPCIKPFDDESLISSAKKTKTVITVENQSVIGGIGGAVCEILSENLPTRVKRLGIPDKFGEVASAKYLFDKYIFGLEGIKQACREMKK
ncbi:transketolase C-terminal domain-containing protein [Lentisphaerota bacterium WC36G]|nr:transketolase family protein [Lentisphaerae bacterium WC36]